MVTFLQLDSEVPAGNFSSWLSEADVPFSCIRVYAGDPIPVANPSAAVICLGGSMGVHDTAMFPYLLQTKTFIKKCLTENIPYLGICLGGQLLADVLGAAVAAGECGEKGMHHVAIAPAGLADPLFTGIPATFPTFQWHNDSFSLPEDAIRLASSKVCPYQAFRYGKCAYGLQFHPEVDRQIVAAWVASDGYSRHTPSLADIFCKSETSYYAISRLILSNFLHIALDAH